MKGGGHAPIRLVRLLGLLLVLTVAVAERVQAAARVQEVVSPSGIRAWLIHEPTIPILSLSLYFRGGSAADPEGRSGLAHMLAGVIDEGAGPYDSEAFRAALDDNAIRLNFDTDRDGISGDLKTLSEHRGHAFELLRLAVGEPRFDAEPVERVRNQILAELRRRESDPNVVANRTWFERAFPDHPYGRRVRGTAESLRAIDVQDLRSFARRHLARDNLLIGVSGDITAEELAPLLDETFGALPARADLPEVPAAPPRVDATTVVPMAIPQSVVTFGRAGIDRQDPDYYAAYVANYILGGGGFSSRLTEEVREKRGLAYSVYSYLYDTRKSPLWLGGLATRNDQVSVSIDLVRAEMARLAAGDVGGAELQNAKTYLTGSFPLRLTSNDQVAKMLVGMQVADLPIDYLERRNEHIEAVTLDDLKRVAARLFSGPLLITVVGAPMGVAGDSEG
jgi:zinc protease